MYTICLLPNHYDNSLIIMADILLIWGNVTSNLNCMRLNLDICVLLLQVFIYIIKYYASLYSINDLLANLCFNTNTHVLSGKYIKYY